MAVTQSVFSGSIPENYDRFLGPMWFDPYAVELAAHLPAGRYLRVLELACGTGIATRRIRDRLEPGSTLVATDLSAPMLERALGKFGPRERVEWLQADAGRLPFAERSFDVVACQFAIMFVPDKRAAIREWARVLVPGGLLVLSTWDSLERNDLARLAHEVCADALRPADPPRFFLTPYGMHDPDDIRLLLAAEGLARIRIESVALPSASPSAEDAARGMIEGTPFLVELRSRGVTDIGALTRAVARRVTDRYGSAPVIAGMQALICSACRP
jgi:ubiquinone/menaquinone biosynthesis C-methylase UbiE